MENKLKFETGDFVRCEHFGESFKAYIDKCPRPDDDLKIYMIRIYGGRGITHAREENLTMIKSKREVHHSVNYNSKK